MRSGVLLGIMSALEKTLVLDKGACLLAPPSGAEQSQSGCEKASQTETFKVKYFD